MNKNNVLKILKYEDEEDRDILANRAEEVDPMSKMKDVISIIRKLENSLKTNDSLIALAAPQIGISKRIFCIRFPNREIKSFINPMVIRSSNMGISRERCASIPNKEYFVPRSKNIIAKYFTREGKIEENIFKDKASEVFLQMCDILDGIFPCNYGLEILPGFDEASDEDKKTIFNMYVENLKNQGIELNKYIDSDADLKASKSAIDFLTSVALGETDVVPETESGVLDFEHSTAKQIKKMDEVEADKAKKLKEKIENINSSIEASTK